MKTLYLECQMGAAGDMLTGALYELSGDRAGFLRKMNALGLPGVKVAAQPSVKCGVTGTHISVTVDGAEEDGHCHHHSGYEDVERLITGLPLSEKVKRNALGVYRLLAEAESRVHGVPVEQIHFHEVGTADAVADILGVCLLLEELSPEKICAGPICVGFGETRCAHGVLPVPAPATAELLRGVPIAPGDVPGELCTPTGAALLRYFVTDFGGMPGFCVDRIGYGMGKKDFPKANCLRAMVGDAPEAGDTVAELSCDLDDMTPEALGFAQERLLAEGALEVFTTPIGMKKCRPGVLLTCLCPVAEAEKFVRLLFQHTTTIGIRQTVCRRYTLARQITRRATPYGEVRVKTASGWGVTREKAEYDDLAAIAREQNIPLADILR